MMKNRLFILYIILFSNLLSGCGTKRNKVEINQDNVKIETKEGDKAIIKTKKDEIGTLKIEGEDAEGKKTNLEITSDMKIPDDFPKKIPIPKQAIITNSNSITTEEGKIIQIYL